jgi:hypothetical protein
MKPGFSSLPQIENIEISIAPRGGQGEQAIPLG